MADTVKATALIAASMALITACTPPSRSSYDIRDVGVAIDTLEGTVVASREVEVAGEGSNVGAGVGGAFGLSGGVVAAAYVGGPLVVLAAMLVGAGIGYFVEQETSGYDGVEYLVQLEDGRTVTIVQNADDQETALDPGTHVLIQAHGTYSRVIADPRPDAPSPGRGWVDPDTIGEAEPNSASDADLLPPITIEDYRAPWLEPR